MDINSVTAPIVVMCEACDIRPATIRMTATDAKNVVLDTVHVCELPCCVNHAGQLISCRWPTTPFLE